MDELIAEANRVMDDLLIRAKAKVDQEEQGIPND
jgi:hypothetical protein